MSSVFHCTVENGCIAFSCAFPAGADIMGELSSLCDCFSGHWGECGFCPEAEFPFAIAVEELVTNIAKYGSLPDASESAGPQAAGEGGIQVQGRIAPSAKSAPGADDLVLYLSDNCVPYDPRNAPPPDLGEDVAERKIGGLGLHMVFHMFELRRYAYEDGGNMSEWVWKSSQSG